MTDKELLEFAAKAVGIDFAWDEDDPGEFWTARNGERVWSAWDPLSYDEHAFDVAVSMSMTIEFGSVSDGAFVSVSAPFCDHFDGYKWDEWLSKDPHRATRRAIVRAAAEIGKESAARNIAAAGGVAPAV